MHALVTANVFEILQMLPGICLTYRINYCPLILVSWVVLTHQHFWEMFIHMFSYKWRTVIYMILHNSAITFNVFWHFTNVSRNFCDIPNKVHPTIFIWQIHQYLYALSHAKLVNNWVNVTFIVFCILELSLPTCLKF